MASRREENSAVGEESFMDTIANLVGILIIFVVIIVARSKPLAIQQASMALQQSQMETIESSRTKVEQLAGELERQQKQMLQHAIEIEYRRAERDAFLDKKNLLEQTLQEKLSSLDEEQRKLSEKSREQQELESQLEELEVQEKQLEQKSDPTAALYHLPTPMAKTVFEKEVHLMLVEGKLVVIPWDRLVESLKGELEYAAQRNSRKDLIEGRLGPIGGFIMDYRLNAKRGMVSNGATTGYGQVISLERFELEPTNEMVMESVSESLKDNGRLKVELAGRNPRETVVTTWVYPDSFGEFRELKEQLFKLGFLSAARPLPHGVRVGAAPTGSQSVAQ